MTQTQFEQIASKLLGQDSDPGLTGGNNLLLVNGSLKVLRSRAHWRDLPGSCGKWKALHKHFTRWVEGDVWDLFFASLIKDRDNKFVMLDSRLQP